MTSASALACTGEIEPHGRRRDFLLCVGPPKIALERLQLVMPGKLAVELERSLPVAGRRGWIAQRQAWDCGNWPGRSTGRGTGDGSGGERSHGGTGESLWIVALGNIVGERVVAVGRGCGGRAVRRGTRCTVCAVCSVQCAGCSVVGLAVACPGVGGRD